MTARQENRIIPCLFVIKERADNQIRTGDLILTKKDALFYGLYLRASLTACPALRIESGFACVYIRSVTDESECPSLALTEATSAPLVMATLADVCRSKCG